MVVLFWGDLLRHCLAWNVLESRWRHTKLVFWVSFCRWPKQFTPSCLKWGVWVRRNKKAIIRSCCVLLLLTWLQKSLSLAALKNASYDLNYTAKVRTVLNIQRIVQIFFFWGSLLQNYCVKRARQTAIWNLYQCSLWLTARQKARGRLGTWRSWQPSLVMWQVRTVDAFCSGEPAFSLPKCMPSTVLTVSQKTGRSEPWSVLTVGTEALALLGCLFSGSHVSGTSLPQIGRWLWFLFCREILLLVPGLQPDCSSFRAFLNLVFLHVVSA